MCSNSSSSGSRSAGRCCGGDWCSSSDGPADGRWVVVAAARADSVAAAATTASGMEEVDLQVDHRPQEGSGVDRVEEGKVGCRAVSSNKGSDGNRQAHKAAVATVAAAIVGGSGGERTGNVEGWRLSYRRRVDGSEGTRPETSDLSAANRRSSEAIVVADQCDGAALTTATWRGEAAIVVGRRQHLRRHRRRWRR